MRLATYTNGQYLDQNAMNLVSLDSQNGIQQAARVWALPGLIHPQDLVWSVSGMIVTVSCPDSFAIQIASGVIAGGVGSTSTSGSTYAVDLAGAMPANGTATVYILAEYQSIQQTPTTIVGPPQANPAFNANYSPSTWYQETVDSISISGSLAQADNLTSFELARVELTAGEASISIADLNFANQSLSTRISPAQYSYLSGNADLTVQNAGVVITPEYNGIVFTLPPVAESAGYPFYFHGGSGLGAGYAMVQSDGADLINGLIGTVAYANPTSIYLLQNMSVALRSDGEAWQVFEAVGALPDVAIGVQSTSAGVASGYAGSAVLSFAVPGPGTLIAWGSRNLEYQSTVAGSAILYINGVTVASDDTELSTSHQGDTVVSGAMTVTAEYYTGILSTPSSLWLTLAFFPAS